MVQYRFRLTGVPPDQAIKLIEVDPNQTIAEIKKSVQREYKLNPILAIQFIFKGKVLPDNLKFAKVGKISGINQMSQNPSEEGCYHRNGNSSRGITIKSY
jgi:hypothetical protein